MFRKGQQRTLGELIRQYRDQLRIGQADLAREIGKLVKGSSYNSSYVSKWENNQDISDPHFIALLEFFKTQLGDKFDEKEFREAYRTHAAGEVPSAAAFESAVDPDALEVIDSAERVLRGEPGIDQDIDPAEKSGGKMGNQDPFSSMDRRSTEAVRRTMLIVIGIIVAVAVIAVVLYVGRGLLDFAAGQMAEQDIAREATRQAFATVTKEAYELDARLTAEVLSAKSDAERRNAEATVVAVAALSTSEAAVLQATVAAQALIATKEREKAVAIAQSTSEAFETVVAANRTATAMVRIMTAEANTPTPTFTPVPPATPTPTWTKQPTYTPLPLPAPTKTPTDTPEPTQTPYPTETYTPVPTATSISNTDPDAILERDEIWYEDGLALRLEVTNFTPSWFTGDLYLTNKTDEQIFVEWRDSVENLRLANDMGLPIETHYYKQTQQFTLLPGMTKLLDSMYRTSFEFRSLENLVNYEFIVLDIRNLSRIDRARWKFNIPK